MACTKPVQILNGPIGGGKTTTVFMKAIRLAAAQKVSIRDGVTRKFRLCVVSTTYRQLHRATLPTWFKRIPRTVGDFKGAENAPCTHRIEFQLADNTVVDFWVDFLAVGENAAEDVMRGYEPTAFMLNEADLLPEDVFTFADGRTSRYPDMADGGPSWYGILMDCNAPTLNNWLYEKVFRKTPEWCGLFRQPAGDGPRAENTANLVPGYYENQMRGKSDWYIKRMIKNIPGYSRAGKPIYPEFNNELHVAQHDLPVIPGLTLLMGLDGGGGTLNPAAIFGQRLGDGRRWIHDELCGEKGTGAMRFGDMLAQRLHERFPMCRTIKAYCDPSATYGVDKKAGEKTWREIIEAKLGIRVEAAPTNRLTPRLEAVRRPLTMLIDGKPAVQYSPRCTMLIEGFNSGYRFRKVEGAEERYTDEPEKNEYSHPHDANQYLHLGDGEYFEILERRTANETQLRQWANAAQHDWDPLSQR